MGLPSLAPFGKDLEYGTSDWNTYHPCEPEISFTFFFDNASSGTYSDAMLNTTPARSSECSGCSLRKFSIEFTNSGRPIDERYSGLTGTSM